MPAIGGSVTGFAIDGTVFSVMADADPNRDLGGFTADVKATGDGDAIMTLTAKPWKIDGLTVALDDAGQLQERLQEIVEKKDWVPVVITMASGLSYSGRGTVTGDIQRSSQNATVELALMGPGKLTQQ